ncbi:YheC/YheD family endospore coat-associated protein [Ferviditalea candida]|uniref:YheC/YheD family protein n=1 Tax=Ferviditalea candida TaxID=3108399 RepID=A0ABU5ZDH0_9BACL|nr:YheC/YheD family protein [Paenibacillaceae bacterium T2]
MSISFSSKRYLGIMICEKKGIPPFSESGFYRQLCEIGGNIGLIVYVFSPDWVDWTANRVNAFVYSASANNWASERFPLPDLIYDRCFFSNKRQYLNYRGHLLKLKKLRPIRFLGGGLKGKLEVSRILERDPEIRPFLPESVLYQGPKTLLSWLKHKDEAVLKPVGGSHGRGILRVRLQGDGAYLVDGRDRNNRRVSERFVRTSTFLQWLRPFIGGRKYILQAYLPLTAATGEAFDVRTLIQKNGTGQWHITGTAVRRGQPGSLTANLHGGGCALESFSFLKTEFGAGKAEQIMDTIRKLSMKICTILEQYHGRLVELGIDLGVDKGGNVWILEVNSKPGRNAFAQINDKKAIRSSVINPIYYARYLLDRRLGGSSDEFDNL